MTFQLNQFYIVTPEDFALYHYHHNLAVTHEKVLKILVK